MSERFDNFQPNFYSDRAPKSTTLRVKQLTPDFFVRRIQDLDYVTDVSGRQISQGFHSITVYQYEDSQNLANLILGREGAIYHVLSPIIYQDNEAYFHTLNGGFHNISFRTDLDCQFVAEYGAMNYVLDHFLQKRHEKGYHFISKDQATGIYSGKTGGLIERIQFKVND
ncbi:MAG: hypothetical protein KIH89_004325 [Candidatus Shapirobacteria bacterium]|nr:hypothetical protein [Candidatus Shapirobacteria bacterium]